MPRKPLESLGAIVREKRGSRKLRETAREIGISPATLLRVESGRIPDVDTFGKMCKWLKKDPAEFLGASQPSQPFLSVSAHFKADQNPTPATVEALAKMVLFAVNWQPRIPEVK